MHEQWQKLMPFYLAGTLSEIEVAELEAHLNSCVECRAALEEWRIITAVTRDKVESRTNTLPLLDIPLNSHKPSETNPPPQTTIIKEDRIMTALPIPQQKPYQIPWTAVAVLILTFFFCLLLLGGLDLHPVPLPLQQGQGLGDIPEDPIALFQLYLDEVWNKQNLDAIPLLLSENHVHHDASMSESRLLFGVETTENYITSDTVVGHEAFAEYVAFEHDILPDVVFSAENLVANGDTISGRVTMTYEEFEATVLVSATIADGKLAETWFDVGTMTEAYMLHLALQTTRLLYSEVSLEDTDFAPFFNDPFGWHWPLGQFVSEDATPPDVAIVTSDDSSGRRCNDKQGEDVAVAHGNLLMVQGIGTCLFDEPFTWGLTLQPTNQRINVETTIVYRIQDGKIVEMWEYNDDPRWWSVTGMLLTGTRTTDSIEQTGTIYDANNPENQIRAFAERYVNKIWNVEEIDVVVLEELYSQQSRFTYNGSSFGYMKRESFADLHEAINHAFPDAQMDAKQIISDLNNVSIPFTWTGTHTNTFEYEDIVLPPSSEVVSVNGVIVLNILVTQRTTTPETQITIVREVWYADFPFLQEMEQIAEG